MIGWKRTAQTNHYYTLVVIPVGSQCSSESAFTYVYLPHCSSVVQFLFDYWQFSNSSVIGGGGAITSFADSYNEIKNLYFSYRCDIDVFQSFSGKRAKKSLTVEGEDRHTRHRHVTVVPIKRQVTDGDGECSTNNGKRELGGTNSTWT